MSVLKTAQSYFPPNYLQLSNGRNASILIIEVVIAPFDRDAASGKPGVLFRENALRQPVGLDGKLAGEDLGTVVNNE